MKSLFNPVDNAELINRINQLKPELQPAWGKMNATHMLYHCQQPMRLGLGEFKMKQGFIGFLFGRTAKKKILSEQPFPKNLPTMKSFIMQGNKNFEEEKAKLIALIKRMVDEGAAAITKHPHPFFGKMPAAEWDALGWKHLDHHLQQFGV